MPIEEFKRAIARQLAVTLEEGLEEVRREQDEVGFAAHVATERLTGREIDEKTIRKAGNEAAEDQRAFVQERLDELGTLIADHGPPHGLDAPDGPITVDHVQAAIDTLREGP